MAKKKIQSQAPKTFFDQLKGLYTSWLKKEITQDNFILQVRDIVELASAPISIRRPLEDQEIKLLKILTKEYIDVFTGNRNLTLDDVSTLASIGYSSWRTPEDFRKLAEVILEGRGKAAELQLGSKKECEAIIKVINKFFTFRELTKGFENDYLVKLVKGEFLQLAKSQFDKIKGQFSKLELKGLLQNIFMEAFELHNIKYLEDVINKFQIDLRSLTLTSKGKAISVMTLFSTLETYELKEQYLKLLTSKGVHPDLDLKLPDATKIICMTAMLNACNLGDRKIVDLLLKYGSDINQVMKVTNEHGVVTYRTPFSVSYGTGDIKFVKYLVSIGSDPLKAMNLMREYLKTIFGDALPPNLFPLPAMGDKQLPDDIRDEFRLQYFAIIEQYFLKEILSYLETLQSASSKEEKKEINIAPPLVEVSLGKEKDAQDLVSEYIKFKQSEQSFLKASEATIENTFDILLLQYSKKGSEEILSQIHEHIAANPELQHYAINSILEQKEFTNLGQDLFMYQPKLLHKFFTLKKQTCDSQLQQHIELATPSGVYKVQSKLKNTAYVAIAPDLKEELKKFGPEIYKKFAEQLSHCKFIKSDSKGVSGIKTYKGVLKLKLAGEDISLSTKQKYLDESSGDILIILDQIHTHKDKEASSITTTRVNGFKDIWQQLTDDGVKLSKLNDEPLAQASVKALKGEECVQSNKAQKVIDKTGSKTVPPSTKEAAEVILSVHTESEKSPIASASALEDVALLNLLESYGVSLGGGVEDMD